jgi:hypothetical protein
VIKNRINQVKPPKKTTLRSEKTEIFYTESGFGVKEISMQAIKSNIKVLRQIAKEGKEYYQRKEMKKVDKIALNGRNVDMQQVIQEAKFFENLNNLGRSQDDILEEARKYLELTENDSIIASSDDKVKELNILTRNLADINDLTNRLEDGKVVSESELESLRKIEQGLADKVKAVYGIEDSDLYE